ncbi:hypothetical protein KC343_g2724 [Hortaea werneckii]|nr:hypothetical protein KC346_g3176 [Hortaea werneckii]KAI7633797.1 hypothetical protein KC343_g2724 [Hortaea werneckii]KAI7679702.1 hypothetical protein KC319_g2622 [Hortaea werneckii]KAI7714114.1 hypothetical protein KC322_g3312 [Hortaea werneckii]
MLILSVFTLTPGTTFASTTTPAGTTSSLRIFERPPVPLHNGSTYSSHPITSGTYLWNGTGQAITQENGFATFGNTSFRTICSSTDHACYSTCSSIVQTCYNSHSSWSSASLSHARSVGVSLGNGTIIKTAYVYTQTSPPETSSTYEVSYRISVYTSNVERYDHRNVGTTTLTTSRWDCQFSSCAPDAVSTVLTSKFYSSHDLTTAVTVKQAYAVNGTASAYTTIPAETKTFTTRVDYLSAPYTEPRPTCSPSTTTQCIFSKDCSKCTISGGTVQLLYFPVSRTSSPASASSSVSASSGKILGNAGWNGTASATGNPGSVMTSAPTKPETAMYENITLTSPSVYISFHTAYANNECGSQVGKRYPGAILPLNPDELSSVYGLYGTLYSTLSDPLFPVPVTSAYLKAASFNLADLNWPVPVSAYQNQPKFKLGGEIFSVVFDDYRPVLAVPPQIREMDPAWKTCELDWEGLYDPPKALQPASTMAGVTTPTGGEIEQTDPPSPSPGPDAPASRTTGAGVLTQTSALAFGNADPGRSGESTAKPYQTDPPSSETERPMADPTQTMNSAGGQDSSMSNEAAASNDLETGSHLEDPTTISKSYMSSRPAASSDSNPVADSPNQGTPLPTKVSDDPEIYDSQTDTGPSIATSTIQFGTTKDDHEGTANVPGPSSEKLVPSITSVSSQLETKTVLTKSVLVGSNLSSSEESPQAGDLGSAVTSGHSETHQDPIATAIIAGLDDDNGGGGGKTVAESDPSSASSKGDPGAVGDLEGSTVEQTAAPQAAQGTSQRGTSAVGGQITQTVASDHSDEVSKTSGPQDGDSQDISTPTHTTDPGDNRLPIVASPSSGRSNTVATVTIEGQPYTATKADSDVVIVNHQTISAGGSGLPIPHATLTVADNGELQMVYTRTQTQNSQSHHPSDTETLNRGVELSFPSTTLTAMESEETSETVLILDGETISVGGPPGTVAGNIISAVDGGLVVSSAGHNSTVSLYDVPVTVTEASSSVSTTTRTKDTSGIQHTADLKSSVTSSKPSSSTSDGRLGFQPVPIWVSLAAFTGVILSCT